jgi:hypothetical protein
MSKRKEFLILPNKSDLSSWDSQWSTISEWLAMANKEV